jgi:DNA-binding PadR family transcriptional regulator
MDPAELLPLTPASFHILLVLAGGPAHGYGIMGEVAQLTDGAVHLGPGTLYRTIHKLVEDGLVEADGDEAGDERRVPYRLTRGGAAVVRAEAHRLAVLVRAAKRRGLLDAAKPRSATWR